MEKEVVHSRRSPVRTGCFESVRHVNISPGETSLLITTAEPHTD
jgi:hypothetical protein